MTYQEIKDRVKEIYEARFDDEAAHNLEDKLLVDVLTSIASFDYDEVAGPSAANLAFAALDSLNIQFNRWKS